MILSILVIQHDALLSLNHSKVLLQTFQYNSIYFPVFVECLKIILDALGSHTREQPLLYLKKDMVGGGDSIAVK